MTIRKVLVEFELDPTEYIASAPDKPDAGAIFAQPVSLPDTQEAATELVKGMTRGEVDICSTRILGHLKLIFRGQATPSHVSGQLASLLGPAEAIVVTLQEYVAKKSFEPLKGPISITCNPPSPNKPYYEVSVWQSPNTQLTSGRELPNNNAL